MPVSNVKELQNYQLSILIHQFHYYTSKSGRQLYKLSSDYEQLEDASRIFGVKQTVHIVIESWPFVFWVPSGKPNAIFYG